MLWGDMTGTEKVPSEKVFQMKNLSVDKDNTVVLYREANPKEGGLSKAWNFVKNLVGFGYVQIEGVYIKGQIAKGSDVAASLRVIEVQKQSLSRFLAAHKPMIEDAKINIPLFINEKNIGRLLSSIKSEIFLSNDRQNVTRNQKITMYKELAKSEDSLVKDFLFIMKVPQRETISDDLIVVYMNFIFSQLQRMKKSVPSTFAELRTTIEALQPEIVELKTKRIEESQKEIERLGSSQSGKRRASNRSVLTIGGRFEEKCVI
jgi:hypothetical protein